MIINRVRLALACALIAVVSASALAQPFPIQDISPPGDDAALSTLAVDAQGNAIVLWGLSNGNGNGMGARSSRYVAATNTWTPAVDLVISTNPRHFISKVVLDSAGNAIAVGRRLLPGGGRPVGDVIAARFSAATGQWGAVTELSPFLAELPGVPEIGIDAAGNATVVWSQPTCFSCLAFQLYSARYSPASGWSTGAAIASGIETTMGPHVGVDAAGNAIATFIRETSTSLIVHGMRYSIGTETWSQPETLGTVTCQFSCIDHSSAFAMNPQGDALLTWASISQGVLQAVRFNAASGTWSSVQTLSSNGYEPEVAADPHGNFIVVSTRDARSSINPHPLQARRYASASGTWEPMVTLIQDGFHPIVVMDGNGDATAIWSDSALVGSVVQTVIQGARFIAAAGAWSGIVTLTGSSTSSARVDGPQPAIDAAGHVRIGWTRSVPPLDGPVQTAVWPAGVIPPASTPGAPTNLRANVAGSTLGLNWAAAPVGAAATGYTVIARAVEGGPVIATAPVGLTTSLSVTAPNGTFVLSVRASNASGAGPESNSVSVTLPQSAAPPPGPPSNLAANVTGTTVNFTWSAPSSGGAVESYLLVAGQTPGFSVPIATAPLGPTPGFVVPGVPPGTFYVRLLAQNAGGMGAASNEVSFTVAAPPPPTPPVIQSPVVNGSTVQLGWSGPAGASYTLLARATPNGPVLVSAPVGGITSLTVPSVGSGTYHVTAVANVGGQTSAESNQIVVVVQ